MNQPHRFHSLYQAPKGKWGGHGEVAIERLSKADQDYVRQQLSSPAATPSEASAAPPPSVPAPATPAAAPQPAVAASEQPTPEGEPPSDPPQPVQVDATESGSPAMQTTDANGSHPAKIWLGILSGASIVAGLGSFIARRSMTKPNQQLAPRLAGALYVGGTAGANEINRLAKSLRVLGHLKTVGFVCLGIGVLLAIIALVV